MMANIKRNSSNKKTSICSTLNVDRNIGINAKEGGPSTFQRKVAEKLFLRRIYTGQRIVQTCDIPNSRAKFLIVFSRDGTKLGCTNGNHNIYVIDVNTKKTLRTLSGHERTPWTIAFHPTDNSILASGCLSGEVRVWNLEDGACEVWRSPGQTAIASLAFHPTVKLLVVATYQDLYFWDWTRNMVYDQTSTASEEEKIRYVKFDSTGDKLITAIALNNNLLSQYDSISFREAYEFIQQRDVLKEFKLIEKFLDSQLSIQKEKEDPSSDCRKLSKGDPVEEMKQKCVEVVDLNNHLPYMCVYHYQAFQNCLNVDCFCPTEFSMSVMNIFKMNALSINYFCDKCYFCRYTWLYTAVFKCQFMISPKSHICYDHQLSAGNTGERNAWEFDNARQRELMAENEDINNGMTEELFKHCFAQYARIHIAPRFASRIPHGVCSKCFTVVDFPSYPFQYGSNEDETRRPFSHDVSERSDCFLNICDRFGFEPAGYFTPFLNSFAELYQYFPSLRQLSTKNDSDKLDLLMTEWEFLYCKLLLINKVVEGDHDVLLKKISLGPQQYSKFRWKFQRTSNSNGYFTPNSDFSVDYHQILIKKFVNGETQSSTQWSENLDNLIRKNIRISESKQATPPATRSECNLCKKFDADDDNSSSQAMRMLRRELDSLTNSISRRYESKTQRNRIQKLFEHQLVHSVSKTVGALFRTIQVTKKCIERHLLASIAELKKLLKLNFIVSPVHDLQFKKIFFRIFVFVVKRIVSFSNILLEFICDFNYDIPKLLVNSHFNMNSPLLLRPYTSDDRSLNHLLFTYQIDRFFVNNSKREPVFDEEYELASSELSDGELSSRASELHNQPQSLSEDLKRHLRTLSERGVVASNEYLARHVKFLNSLEDNLPAVYPPDTNDESLQNVASLFEYFQHQISEDIRERRLHHPLHRLQMWDFSKLEIPDISSKNQNIVVTECKVHNDATIAISNDDSLVAVLVSPNQFDQSDWLGVFSLERKTLGHIMCTISPRQLAVSLSFSPTDQFLAIGYSYSYKKNIKMTDVIGIQREIDMWRDYSCVARPLSVATSLIDAPNLERLHLLTTINCIKWLSVPGQGLVFGNSVGEIKFVL